MIPLLIISQFISLIDSFTFKANDGQSDSNIATITILGGKQRVSQAIATDIDGNLLTYSVVTQPLYGTVDMLEGGMFIYTPKTIKLIKTGNGTLQRSFDLVTWEDLYITEDEYLDTQISPNQFYRLSYTP